MKEEEESHSHVFSLLDIASMFKKLSQYIMFSYMDSWKRQQQEVFLIFYKA